MCSQVGNIFITNAPYPVGYVLFQYQFYLLTPGLGLGCTQVSVREVEKQSLISWDQYNVILSGCHQTKVYSLI